MKRIPIPAMVTAIVIILVLVTYSVTYQVRFSEVAVKVRLGKPKAVIEKAGLKIKWPLPIEDVRKYDTRLRVLDTPETEKTTRDGQNVIWGCFAVWRITDPLLFYKRVPLEKTAEEKIRTRIIESRDKVIGQHNWSEFVNLDEKLIDKSYEQIEREILEDAAPGIRSEFGVEVRRVGIWRTSLPEEATASVQKSMRQERERLAARYREEGESLKQAIVARAQSQSDAIIAFARSKAAAIEAAGVKASERIFERIGDEDTEFFIWLRWLEALEAALKTKTTIFLDSSTELYEHFSEPPTESMLGPD